MVLLLIYMTFVIFILFKLNLLNDKLKLINDFIVYLIFFLLF